MQALGDRLLAQTHERPGTTLEAVASLSLGRLRFTARQSNPDRAGSTIITVEALNDLGAAAENEAAQVLNHLLVRVDGKAPFGLPACSPGMEAPVLAVRNSEDWILAVEGVIDATR